MKPSKLILLLCLCWTSHLYSQQSKNLVLIKDPYSDSRTGPEKLKGLEQMDNAGLSHQMLKESIQLIGQKVIPLVHA